MTGLWVELTRLRWRRAVLLLLAGTLLVPVLLFAGTAWNTRPMSQTEVDALLADRYAQREVARCEREPEQYVGTDSDGVASPVDPDTCADIVAGWYGGRMPLDVAQELTGTVIGTTTFVLLLLLLMGTTFVGHDWNTGSMSNQLLFEPRRVRVWVTKAAAVTLVALVVGLAVLSAYWTGLLLLSESRDLPVTDAVRGDGYRQVLRTGVLAGATGLGGYALTMLFRSTVATIGVLFGLAVASGAVLGIVGEAHGRWTPPINVMAVVQGELTYYDDSDLPPECRYGVEPVDPDCDPLEVVTASQGGLYVGALLALACAGSVASFRRRDVP